MCHVTFEKAIEFLVMCVVLSLLLWCIITVVPMGPRLSAILGQVRDSSP